MSTFLSTLLTPGGPFFGAHPIVSSSPLVRKVTDPYISGGFMRNGALGDNTADDSPPINYWLSQTQPGGVCYAPAGGIYRLKSGLNLTNAVGVRFIGEAWGSTQLRADDSAGNIGHLITLTDSACCEITGFTMSAPASRTAGNAIQVVGGAPAHVLAGYGISQGGHAFDVDMNFMFGGVQYDNNASGKGDWGSYIGGKRVLFWTNHGTGGGHGIFFNALNGASQKVGAIFCSNDNPTVGKGIWFRGSGDITLYAFCTFGLGTGFLCDPSANPSAAGDSLVQMTDCQFDSNAAGSGPNMVINPGAGVGGRMFFTFDNLWIAGSNSHGLYVTGNAAPISHVGYNGGVCWGNGGCGVRVDNGAGTAKVKVSTQVHFESNLGGDQVFT